MKAIYAQFLVALTASSVMIPYGQTGAWTMVAIPALQNNQNGSNLTSDQVGWIASAPGIFVIAGSFMSKYMMDAIGRRNSLILAMTPLACAYLVMGFDTYAAFIIGRALMGVSYGFIPILALYFGEIVSDEVRGRANFIANIIANVGTLPILIASPYLTLHTLHLFLLAPVLYVMVLLYLIPESPYFYLMKGETFKAEKALSRVREDQDVPSELLSIQIYVKKKAQEKTSFSYLWRSRGTTRAFLINLFLVVYLELSGTSAIKDYAGELFERDGLPLDKSVEMSITMAITIVTACIAAFFVDNVGRRGLLFLSSIPMIMSLLMATTFYFFKEMNYDVSELSWIPWFSLLLFNVARSAGLRPLKHILMSEYYPLNVKATAASLVYLTESLVESLSIKLFQELSDLMGFGTVFFICLLIFLIGTGVMYFFMPETKNLPFSEIEQVFEQHCK